ncbi:Stilbene synthase [Rhynchospora pubera]|uniref:chalcone synthase n=1 Tax=Rhynchospora pubera TaxID=906938 RepID=A0AAV8FU51_9POAL|nr:Stilbene synthase [Rhynchospora pubera]
MLKNYPSLISYKEPTLDIRNRLLAPGVDDLAKKAAEEALKEWGQPRSRITHLIFHTASSCVDLPGPDYRLMNLLGLEPTVSRCMLFYTGCYGGGTVIRIAKDLAENNPGARVLVVCRCLLHRLCSVMVLGPSSLALTLFEILSSGQSIIPGTAEEINGCMQEAGLIRYLKPSVPMHISNNISKCLTKAFTPLGITDWNSLFCAEIFNFFTYLLKWITYTFTKDQFTAIIWTVCWGRICSRAGPSSAAFEPSDLIWTVQPYQSGYMHGTPFAI